MSEITIRQPHVRVSTNRKSPLDSLATTLSRPLPDACGRLIYLSLALAVVFGRPRQNFQEIARAFPIAKRFPDRIDSLLQMPSESGTHQTLATR
jgi:hypothetical protein